MIWLHLGLHKTGTTSIQAALRLTAHRRGLSVWTIGDSPPALTPEWSAWVRERAAVGDVVVSDETLLGDPVRGYPGLVDRLAAIRAALPAAEVSAVVGLRRQSTWLSSTYLQTLQQGETWSGSEFWASIEASPFLHWPVLLARVSEALQPSSLRVLLHDPSRDAVSDFFWSCGMKPPGAARTPLRDNVSITPTQAPIVRRLNASMAGRPPAIIRDFMQLVAGPGPRTGHTVFPADIQMEITGRFSNEWRALVSGVAGDPGLPHGADERQLADWPVSPEHCVGDDLSDVDVAEEAIRLLTVAIESGGTRPVPSWSRRLRQKASSDPRDLPAAVVRALRRRS